MIPDDVVDQVREHADIVAIVGETVKLKRSGSSYRGPCPFHQGKDPNFSVSPRGGYMCFVCHEKGDVFTFVQKRLGMDFVDAVKYVGAKSGIEVKDIARDQTDAVDPRERFWEMNAAAAEYFRSTLWGGEIGTQAREYLANREISHECAERFGVGFAPRDVKLLRKHLAALGYDDAQQTEAGLLVVRGEGEEPRPRFRGRLMFPIYDAQSRVIAFGGRVIGEGEPKYLNSPESPTFQKGSTLYGLNWAKHAIRRDERVLLVEGYFDCVRLLDAGIESTVAPLGTALTDAQAELIRKYSGTAFLLYDSDRAGLKATFRAGDVLLRQGIKVLVVTLPDGDDPDTFVRKHGRAGLEAQLAQAIDVFERKVQILERGGWFSDLRRKRVALDRLLPTIRACADPIAHGLYVGRAAESVGIAIDALRQELREPERRALRPEQRQPSIRASAAPTSDTVQSDAGASAETWLVQLLLSYRHLIEQAAERVDPKSFRDARLRAAYTELLRSDPNEEIGSLILRLPDHAIELVQSFLEKRPLPNPQEVLDSCARFLKKREVVERLDDIQRELPLAGDIEKNDILTSQQKLFEELKLLGGHRWKKFTYHPRERGQHL